MNHKGGRPRDQWGSKVGFLLAAAGSAIGLGNIWKFPYVAGSNGGGAFIFLYFAIVIALGFTIMLAEFALGRHTQLSPVGAYRKLRKSWAWAGGIGVLAGFLILTFYSVIGGWVIKYVVMSVMGGFHVENPSLYGDLFGEFIGKTGEPLLYQGIFMLATVGIVIGGIKQGIEKYAKILMPALFVMMLVVMVRSLTLPNGWEGVRFLLVPDFSAINSGVVLAALGQVFFSLSLGMGTMITYGSYLSKQEDLALSAVQIPLLDTLVALMAALTVLPAVFSFGFNPTDGPGLLFITMPAVFGEMPLGAFFGVVFFVLVFFAALTSSISLLEVCVSFTVDELKWNRRVSSLLLGLCIYLLGIPSSLGFGTWSNYQFLSGKNILETVSFFSEIVLMPLGGLLLCIFIGWVWGLKPAYREITNQGRRPFALLPLWGFLIKYAAPVVIFLIFIQGLFSA